MTTKLKNKKFVFKVNNRLKGAYAETDLDKRTISINKKAHKSSKLQRVARNKNGTESLINTEAHELMHMKHPKMHEKTVYKKTKKTVRRMSKKQKSKIYAKFR